MPPPEEARRARPSVETIGRLAELDAAAWNALTAGRYPFLAHEFLTAAEETGCVSPETGWTPCHLVVRDADGGLRAAMPLYEKTHSWGEFVFDWAWANAYERAGHAYYPKLVSATPFTPAPSPRLLCRSPDDEAAARALVAAAIGRARERGLSSLHVQFPLETETTLLRDAGLKLRRDCQFHWHNAGYRSFDEFLATFSSKKRKNVRRDRRLVGEQGIRFRRLTGAELEPDDWQRVCALLANTFFARGSWPYLDVNFFIDVGRRLPHSLLVVLAERHGEPIACSLFYVGEKTLYGRYWGSVGHFDALHFETCYYQGIDYCIDAGLETFEPGTQGEHKIARGFVPVTTWSAHWLAEPRFFAAIGDYLNVEGRRIDAYADVLRRHAPYRRAPAGDGGEPDA